MKNYSICRLIGCLTSALVSGAACADTDFNVDPCTLTIGGQLQYNVTRTMGGQDLDTNNSHTNDYTFLDLRLQSQCRITNGLSVEAMLRQRPIVGSDFPWQSDRVGSREAWLGVGSSKLGAVRAGRFLTKMWSVADYPYGDAISSPSSDYGSAPTPVTRSPSIRYIAPSAYGLQSEITLGGSPENRDLELYGNYRIGALTIDAVFDRAVMNGAYKLANGGTLPFGDRKLVNSAFLLGGRYDFSRGANVRAYVKSNLFSMPSDSTGVYSTDGTLKTVTRITSLVMTGSYPLPAGFTLKAGLVRYLDSTTRGQTANDGATVGKLGLVYAFYKNATIEFDVRAIRLDKAGAIPGSGAGVNRAIPDSTDSRYSLGDRRYVFAQSYSSSGFNSPSVNAFGITVQYQF